MEENKDLFECPSCGTLVNADAEECPGCNAVFEQQDEGAHPPNEDTENTQVEQSKSRWNMFPPPPGYDLGKKKSSEEEDDMIPSPMEEPPNSISVATNTIDKKGDTPLSVREFSGKPFKTDYEDEDSHDYEEEQPEISQDEQGYTSSIQNETDGEDLTPPISEKESNDSPFDDKENSPDYDLPEGLRALSRLDEDNSTVNNKYQRQSQNEQVISALKDYSARRRRQHLLGTIFLGLGIVLFALLWLVVVYDVLVTETTSGFGAHVALILVGAGCLFTMGLYLILTYPKSSIIDVLASMSRSNAL